MTERDVERLVAAIQKAIDAADAEHSKYNKRTGHGIRIGGAVAIEAIRAVMRETGSRR